MTCNITELFAQRHSFYDINSNCPLSDDALNELIKNALMLYPSPFNSQSARVILLLHNSHQTFWQLTEQKLLETAPKDKHDGIHTKIASFANSYGTVLFFSNSEDTQKLSDKFPLYADNFKNWAYQCNAILQFMIWTAFADKKIGASLQHYNPLIDNEVKAAFNIPQSWELVAQMPFGGINKTPEPHKTENIDEKFLTRN